MARVRSIITGSSGEPHPPVLQHISSIIFLSFVLLSGVTAISAESPKDDPGLSDGIALRSRIESPNPREQRFGASLKILLASDAAVRALDGYSTARMLRNRCNGVSTAPVCNEENFLPDFLTRSNGAIYGYEGGVWLAQALVVHKLAKHHQRLAKLIPTLDIATTLPFAVNNLRLPVNPHPH